MSARTAEVTKMIISSYRLGWHDIYRYYISSIYIQYIYTIFSLKISKISMYENIKNTITNIDVIFIERTKG